MYTDALSFLEDERDMFRAYEALDALSDEQLAVRVEAAGGWSGRDLMGHIVHGQELALASARELAMGEQSPTMDRFEAEWNAGPGAGDAINEAALVSFRALSMTELRARFKTVGGELRGYLTVVPESRWIKHSTHQEYFLGELTAHYEEHEKDLRAILEALS
jgi:hypothetical protein